MPMPRSQHRFSRPTHRDADAPFDTVARRDDAFETWTSLWGPCRIRDCDLHAAYPCGRCREHAE
jgi:hypothetical protein